jgi:type 1 fimbria pilin
MRGQRWWVLGCFFVVALGSPAAKAGGGGTVESGSITFVGAIVAPTCNVANNPSVLKAAAGPAQVGQSSIQNCLGAGETVANPSRIYAVTVSHLSGSDSDRVLQYFDNYVRAGQPGTADPVLVTQAYE